MNNTVPVDLDDLAPLRSSAAAAPAERHLRIAPAASRRLPRVSRNPLMASLVAVGIVLLILAAQLGLSIAISQGAYESRALQIEQRDLGRVERLLSQNVDKLASPQNLAENAAALGMVQNAQPATLRLSDGAILGSLESETTEAKGNLVPNSTLESMPVVDASGLLVSRSTVASAAASTDPPKRWKGRLPAPETH
ncbi:MAG: hypothetical protein ACK5LO_04500 [Leucobacter sp.]